MSSRRNTEGERHTRGEHLAPAVQAAADQTTQHKLADSGRRYGRTLHIG